MTQLKYLRNVVLLILPKHWWVHGFADLTYTNDLNVYVL